MLSVVAAALAAATPSASPAAAAASEAVGVMVMQCRTPMPATAGSVAAAAVGCTSAAAAASEAVGVLEMVLNLAVELLPQACRTVGGRSGGFGGGHAGPTYGGGGGLGAGGDIFVQQGGSLTIEGGTLSGGAVTKGDTGSEGTNGAAYGTGIFIQGNQTITFAPASGKTLTISDVIADMTGSNDPSHQTGAGSVVDSSAGTVVLSGSNTYTGGTTMSGGGTLELAASGAAGSGTIAFGGSGGTLQIDGAALLGTTFSNTIDKFAVGDVLDLRGLAFVAGATAQYNSGSHILTVSGGGVSKQLTLTNPASTTFATPTSDGSGGTQITLASLPPSVSADVSASWREGSAPTPVSPNLTVTDSTSTNLISATVAITSGTFAGDGDVLGFNTSGTSISGSYNSATETLTLSGSDTLAHYQSVLESVTFSAAANPTDFGADPPTRTITWTANDGSASDSGTTTVNITPTTVYVTSGHSSTGLTISSGITLDILSGGTALATTVTSGGTELVQSGGSASGSIIDSGGSDVVSGGGTELGAQISGGQQDVFGYASGGIVFAGSQVVESGGSASSTMVSAGGFTVVLSGGSGGGSIIDSGGSDVVSGGGSDLGTQISGGAQLDYGYASGATIFGGSQVVESGGTTSGSTISSGREYVAFGGTAVGVVFGGAAGNLTLETPRGLSGIISDWQIGDVVDFAHTSIVSASIISGSSLHVVESGGQAFDYQLAGLEADTQAHLQSDGAGGTDVTLTSLPPTVSVSIDHTDVNLAASTAAVTFTFTQVPTDFSLADVTTSGGTLSNLSGSGTSYTATFNASGSIDTNAASITVTSGGYHDVSELPARAAAPASRWIP
jgi:autotransporter passenger strand-loop-strand repeat protein